MPSLLPRPRFTRLSTSSHAYSVHLSNARVDQYLHFFIPYTGKLWNVLPLSVFPLAYYLNSFKRGVSRGCVLAPVLFNLFTAAVTMKYYANNITENGVSISCRLEGSLFNLIRLRARTRVFTKTIVELQYADDAAFVSHTEHRLQNILDSVCESYSRMGLKINTQKTELLPQPTGHPPHNNLYRAPAPESGPPFYLLGLHSNI